MLIKARKKDTEKVIEIYARIQADESSSAYSSWKKDEYPTPEIAVRAAEKGNLYLFYEEGFLKGSVIMDGEQPDDYGKIQWKHIAPKTEILILHTLCVDPDFVKRGVGSRILFEIEAFARDSGYKIIRFDTYRGNAPAVRLYLKNGYLEAGLTDIFVYGKSRPLRCFEKRL